MSSTKGKLATQEARYLLTLDYSVLPLDFRDLRQALAKNGYELTPVRNLPPPPTRISFSGEIGRKKDAIVTADSEAGEIGVISRSLSEALASFDELSKLVAEEIGINLYSRVKNYHVMAHYKLDSGKLPLQEIPKTENKEFVKKLSQIMHEDLLSSSIRLAKKDSSMNQGGDWIDIAIEPDLVYENRYHIGVVFRNSNREKTETFVRDLEANLLKMIEQVEA